MRQKVKLCRVSLMIDFLMMCNLRLLNLLGILGQFSKEYRLLTSEVNVWENMGNDWSWAKELYHCCKYCMECKSPVCGRGPLACEFVQEFKGCEIEKCQHWMIVTSAKKRPWWLLGTEISFWFDFFIRNKLKETQPKSLYLRKNNSDHTLW